MLINRGYELLQRKSVILFKLHLKLVEQFATVTTYGLGFKTTGTRALKALTR